MAIPVESGRMEDSKTASQDSPKNRQGQTNGPWHGWITGPLAQLQQPNQEGNEAVMPRPSRNPVFPAPPAGADHSSGTFNPSLSRIKILHAGLLDRLIRVGLPLPNMGEAWFLQYAMLTDTSLHFFSGNNGEYLSNHHWHLHLSRIKEVRPPQLQTFTAFPTESHAKGKWCIGGYCLQAKARLCAQTVLSWPLVRCD
mmetsp:Transcript_34024/g.96386  ORF Transcript_34024/g.96386 Transcript_34024/m.96386 type:complete len:197 (-) Transcript_34024:2783-3373(-)